MQRTETCQIPSSFNSLPSSAPSAVLTIKFVSSREEFVNEIYLQNSRKLAGFASFAAYLPSSAPSAFSAVKRFWLRLRCAMFSAVKFKCIWFVIVIASGLVSAASTRPHYGGTVRILMQHKIESMDPGVEIEYPADREKLADLVFETLTDIDGQGKLRPRLAASWQADAGQRVWQFQLRAAGFHDGSAVTSTLVVANLKAAMPDWKLTPSGKLALTIETPSPAPHLPELLALSRFAIVKRLPNNVLAGSGPYKLAEWQAGERALLAANDDYWGGRPFVDAIEVQMGFSLREHLLERNLGRDHAAELSIDQLRALEQSSQTLVVSRPADLLVVAFPRNDQNGQNGRNGKKPVDPRLRAAFAATINRQVISNVLLQRKSAPASALLPQWLTGYEFIFPSPDADQVRKWRAENPGSASLTLAYDFSDPASRIVAERMAVDAREAGIMLQIFGDPHINTKSARRTFTADAVLLRLPLHALDPAAALAGIADDLDLGQEITTAIESAARPEELYEAESKALSDNYLIPVAHVSEALWINNNVHNWQQLADGSWRLEQLWVEQNNK